MEEHEFIRNLRSVGKETPDLGSIAMWIGELESGGYPVPKGIVITNKALDLFLKENGIAHELFSMIRSGRSPAEISERISRMVMSGAVSQRLMKSLMESMEYNMEKVHELGWVSLIASPSSKILPVLWNERNMFTHGVSLKGLEEGLKEMWKLSFIPGAVELARNDLNIVLSSVVLLDPVEAVISGWLITDDSSITVKSSFGYPRGFNDQKYDLFIINRSDFSIKERKIAEKDMKIVIERGGFKVVKKLVGEETTSPSINEDMLIKLATLGLDVEWHLGDNIILQWVIKEEPMIILAVKKKEVEMKKEEKRIEVKETGIISPPVTLYPIIIRLFLRVDDPLEAERLGGIADGFVVGSRSAQKLLQKLSHTIILEEGSEVPQGMEQKIYFMSKNPGSRALLKVENLTDILLYKKGFSGILICLDTLRKALNMGHKEVLDLIGRIIGPMEGNLVLAQLDEIPDVDTLKKMVSLGITGVVLRSVDEEKLLQLRRVEKELLLSTISLIWKKSFNIVHQ